MLVLKRLVGETIVIDNMIVVKIISISSTSVSIGIQAPTSIPINRGEVEAVLDISNGDTYHHNKVRDLITVKATSEH